MQRRILLTVLTVVAAATLVPGLVAAQEGPRVRDGRRGPDPARMLERMEHRLDEMKGPLNLNQRQEARIRTVLREGAAEARRVLEQQPDRSPERREALRQVRWQTEDRVHAVLTCEQRESFRQLRREHRRERRGDRHERRERRERRGGHQPDGGI